MQQTLRRISHWASDVEPVVLVSLLVIVAGIWGFISLADRVQEGRTQAFDERVLTAVRRLENPAQPVGPPWMAEVGRDVTALGGVAVLLLATVAVLGFLGLSRKLGLMTFVLLATLGGLGLSSLLKVLFVRPRPSVVPHLSHAYTSSFPSGHSLMSAVVYLTLGALLTTLVTRRRLKVYILAVSLSLTGLVGISRVYMGVHYPTDVLAGWMTGLAWAVLCWTIARWLQRRGAVESPDPPCST
jgi:undecaprenyl-diphosphatase